MNLRESKSKLDPAQTYSFAMIQTLRNAGFLINRVAHNHDNYKITIHENADQMQSVQNGIVLFVGTWDETKAFLRGMAFVVEAKEQP